MTTRRPPESTHPIFREMGVERADGPSQGGGAAPLPGSGAAPQRSARLFAQRKQLQTPLRGHPRAPFRAAKTAPNAAKEPPPRAFSRSENSPQRRQGATSTRLFAQRKQLPTPPRSRPVRLFAQRKQPMQVTREPLPKSSPPKRLKQVNAEPSQRRLFFLRMHRGYPKGAWRSCGHSRAAHHPLGALPWRGEAMPCVHVSSYCIRIRMSCA